MSRALQHPSSSMIFLHRILFSSRCNTSAHLLQVFWLQMFFKSESDRSIVAIKFCFPLMLFEFGFELTFLKWCRWKKFRREKACPVAIIEKKMINFIFYCYIPIFWFLGLLCVSFKQVFFMLRLTATTSRKLSQSCRDYFHFYGWVIDGNSKL